MTRSSPRHRSSRWPALADADVQALAPLEFDRAVWGKLHGGEDDFRWLATTPDFDPVARHLERELALGAEDEPPAPFALWRSLGGEYLATTCRSSGSIDAQGRSCPLAKHVLHWRREPGTPAAVGALLLASQAERLSVDLRRDDLPPGEDESVPRYPLEVELPLAVSPDELDRVAEVGLLELREATRPEDLARFYGEILAGIRPAVLTVGDHPLGPAALAALLLPLDPERAASLSLAGWVPSARPKREDLGNLWDGVAVGPELAAALAAPEVPGERFLRRGEVLAEALCRADPSRIAGAPTRGTSGTEGPSARPIELAMWGTTGAGKTVFLAQLIVASGGAEEKRRGWSVWPTEALLQFSHAMRDRIERDNHFPPATVETGSERVDYRFRRESDGLVATLSMEDRAGVQWQRLDAEVEARLRSADGIVLVIDPQREAASRDAQVRRTLDQLAAGREATRDPRPLAVCLSKADLLIETPEDLRLARNEPEEFVRRHLDIRLLTALEQYYADFRLFPTSAIGVRLHWGVVEPAVFYDESFTPRIHPGARPIHLLAPFTWLLDRAAARRREEAA